MCDHPTYAVAVEIHLSLCVDIAEECRQGRALRKSHCQLFGRGDPCSKSHGDLSFLECCCYKLSCERQADAIVLLSKEFHR